MSKAQARSLRFINLLCESLPRVMLPRPNIAGHRLDPFLAILRRLRAFKGRPPSWHLSPEAAREQWRAELLPLRAQWLVAQVDDIDIDGADGKLLARHYRPDAAQALPVLLVYLHGGGYVLGDLDTHDDICRQLCRDAGVQVLSVAYRLAPEHPFPCGLNDALAAMRWAQLHAAAWGITAEAVAIGGDSAGATLAAVVAHQLAREGQPPVAQCLFYPGTDLMSERPSQNAYGHGLFLSVEERAWFYQHYLGDEPMAKGDPRVSPLWQKDLSLTPPTVLCTAELDMLRDEGLAYAMVLRKAGVELRHFTGEGLGHGFVQITGVHSTSRRAVKQAAQALRDLVLSRSFKQADNPRPTSSAHPCRS